MAESTSPSEAEDIGGGMNFSGRALFPDMIREDLFTTASRFQNTRVPDTGRKDLLTPAPVAVECLYAMQSPSKTVHIIEEVGHLALVRIRTTF